MAHPKGAAQVDVAARLVQLKKGDLETAKDNKRTELLGSKINREVAGITTTTGSYEMSYSMTFIDELRHRNDFSSGHAGNPSVAFRDKNGVNQSGEVPAVMNQILDELETQMYADTDHYETKLDAVNDATSVDDVEIITW